MSSKPVDGCADRGPGGGLRGGNLRVGSFRPVRHATEWKQGPRRGVEPEQQPLWLLPRRYLGRCPPHTGIGGDGPAARAHNLLGEPHLGKAEGRPVHLGSYARADV
jgi:hypothetical protein